MNTQEKIKAAENRPERFEGKFSSFQELGKRYAERETEYSKDPYSERQNELYKRTLSGLSYYSERELKTMHYGKQARIKKKHKIAQKEINTLKQERVIEFTNKLFSMFHKSTLANDIIELYSEPDPKYFNKMSFRDLGIEKDDIVNRLVSKEILPVNFNEL